MIILKELSTQTKIDFETWSYTGKFEFKKSRKSLISNSVLENYIFLTNNACESVNNLINNTYQKPIKLQ